MIDEVKKIPEPDRLLTPEEIGDALDLEREGAYPRSDGSAVHTINVDNLIAKTASSMRVECQEGVKKVLRETGVELEKWMNKETAPYKRLAQAGHAIARLKRGQALSEQEGIK